MRLVRIMMIWLVLPATAQAADYALVVGVNHCPRFQLPDGSKPRALRGAEADAESIAELLVKTYHFEPDNVTLIKGERATLAELRVRFQTLQRQLKPTDRLVFHFSGHGTQVPDQKPFDEKDDLDEALCLFDSESNGRNLLLDDELGRVLEDLPASAVTVILDCCHAGTANKGLDDDLQSRYLPIAAVPAAVAKETPWQDLCSSSKSFGRETSTFFACRSEEQAYERRLPIGDGKETVRAGQFTHFLQQGLKTGQADLNGDRRITQEELRQYIELRLNDTFNKQRPLPTDQQHPSMDSTRPESHIFFLDVR